MHNYITFQKFLISLKIRSIKGTPEEMVLRQMKLWVVCNDLHNEQMIHNWRSQRVYEAYKVLCQIYGYDPESKIALSRFICRWFPYKTALKRVRIDGLAKPHRFFLKK